MSTGSLTTHPPQLQGGAGEGRGGGGAGVIFPFADLHANAAQERQLFSGCQAGWFLFPAHRDAGEDRDAVIHTPRWSASAAAADTELLRVGFL